MAALSAALATTSHKCVQAPLPSAYRPQMSTRGALHAPHTPYHSHAARQILSWRILISLPPPSVSLQLEGFLIFSMFFQRGELRAGTALLGRTLLTLGFPGELIGDKIDGVFISVLIATATLTWRLQKHQKATT